mmetsp:Transcript_17931/g.32463  ORF Transcript_17931/g.32463 Transcript_17931/m.32463 type:complete len:255 (-) Transcript_17931:59-823(-)
MPDSEFAAFAVTAVVMIVVVVVFIVVAAVMIGNPLVFPLDCPFWRSKLSEELSRVRSSNATRDDDSPLLLARLIVAADAAEVLRLLPSPLLFLAGVMLEPSIIVEEEDLEEVPFSFPAPIFFATDLLPGALMIVLRRARFVGEAIISISGDDDDESPSSMTGLLPVAVDAVVSAEARFFLREKPNAVRSMQGCCLLFLLPAVEFLDLFLLVVPPPLGVVEVARRLRRPPVAMVVVDEEELLMAPLVDDDVLYVG